MTCVSSIGVDNEENVVANPTKSDDPYWSRRLWECWIGRGAPDALWLPTKIATTAQVVSRRNQLKERSINKLENCSDWERVILHLEPVTSQKVP